MTKGKFAMAVTPSNIDIQAVLQSSDWLEGKITRDTINAMSMGHILPMPRTAAPSRLLRPHPKIATIYFIGERSDGPVKIGFAVNVAFRLRDLQSASPVKLELLAATEDHPALEREYHKRFAAHRLHGEWFSRCPEILAEIARLSERPAA